MNRVSISFFKAIVTREDNLLFKILYHNYFVCSKLFIHTFCGQDNRRHGTGSGADEY